MVCRPPSFYFHRGSDLCHIAENSRAQRRKRRTWTLIVSGHVRFCYSYALFIVHAPRPTIPQDHIIRGRSPSPTHIETAAHLRATYGHQRHESDTLRSAVGNLPSPQAQALVPVRPQSTSPKLTEAHRLRASWKHGAVHTAVSPNFVHDDCNAVSMMLRENARINLL